MDKLVIMSNPVVMPAGSGRLNFDHACERVEYWKSILQLTEIDYFKELNDFMEAKATGCIEEWQYIKSVLCPNHHMEVINHDSKWERMACPTCNYMQLVRQDNH